MRVKSAAAAVGHIVGAKRDQFVLRRCHVHAASLQPFEIDIPRVLKSHTRDAQRMALNPIEEIQGCACPAPGCRFAAIGRRGWFVVPPVPADVIAGSCGRILQNPLRPLIPCGCHQYTVFSQHGERRKGAVGCLSTGGQQILHLQLPLSLILDGGQDIG
jgi:hypothetical protein